METQELIIVDVFCKEYQIQHELIHDLEEFGLIKIIQKDKIKYFERNQIVTIEKIVRLHTDLNINKEGIEVILDLLGKIDHLNQQNKQLKNRLDLYE